MRGKTIVLALCLGVALAGCGSRETEAPQETQAAETEVQQETQTDAAEASEAEEPEETAGEADTQETPEDIQEETTEGEQETMKIQVQANGNTIIFELNDSQAAADLYEQLPLTVENEDFSNNEKTFYPPKKLDTSGAPQADGSVGTLAYYEPWGDVVLFYGSYSPNGSLYALGQVTEGSEFISEITGEMVITAVE